MSHIILLKQSVQSSYLFVQWNIMYGKHPWCWVCRKKKANRTSLLRNCGSFSNTSKLPGRKVMPQVDTQEVQFPFVLVWIILAFFDHASAWRDRSSLQISEEVSLTETAHIFWWPQCKTKSEMLRGGPVTWWLPGCGCLLASRRGAWGTKLE